jgi:hypothetical protein
MYYTTIMTTLSSTNYKILLDNDKNVSISEDILTSIPALNKLIETIKKDDKILDKMTLDLQSINSETFAHIITITKYNLSSTNSETEYQKFNETFIKNMDDDTLTDFILTAHHFGLEKFKQLGVMRFKGILNDNTIEGIRTELKVKNDLTSEEIKNIAVDNEWIEQ